MMYEPLKLKFFDCKKGSQRQGAARVEWEMDDDSCLNLSWSWEMQKDNQETQLIICLCSGRRLFDQYVKLITRHEDVS